MTTVEGIFYCTLIAHVDRSFTISNNGLSGAIAKVGEWSFGIYLLHFLLVAPSAQWIENHILRLNNFYLASAVSVVPFLAAVFVARLSFRCLEHPFLQFRTPYFREPGAGRVRPCDMVEAR